MSAWTAIVGASKYAAAVASGDIATPDEQALRIARCRTCPSLRVYPVPLLGVYAGFCGTPFKDKRADYPATCGCLTAWGPPPPDTSGLDQVVKLRVLAGLGTAGKACVASERCPQGRWIEEAAQVGG